MVRWSRPCIIIALLVLSVGAVFAQADPAQPPEPEVTPIVIPGGDAGIITEEPEIDPPVDSPAEAQGLQLDRATQILVDARLDLERLADVAMPGSRPEGWSGSIDVRDPQLALLLRLDLEILAGTLLGANTRPDGWFGTVASTPFAVARDIRHDLELLADRHTRPEDWAGSEPLLRCDRSTQALVSFLERGGVFALQADRTSPDFCRQAAVEVSRFVEINYLADPSDGQSLVVPGLVAAATASNTIDSNFAVAFLDRGALRRAGVMPNGTPIEPIARSTRQFSNMALVRGEDFTVFVDYQFTTISRAAFEALPDVDSVDAQTSCGARWCVSQG